MSDLNEWERNDLIREVQSLREQLERERRAADAESDELSRQVGFWKSEHTNLLREREGRQGELIVELTRRLKYEYVFEQRRIVGTWLRTRAMHAENAARSMVFHQLAADADHSDLLTRLFSGKQPLPYEEWVRLRG